MRGRIWKGLYAPVVAECSEKAWNTSVIAEVPEHLRFLFQTAQPCGRPRVHELTHQRLHLRAVLSRCEARIADGEALHTEGFTPFGEKPDAWPGLPTPVLEYAKIALREWRDADAYSV